MKNFMKMFLASLLAFCVASLLPFFIFVGIIASLTSSKDTVVEVKDKSILVINLSKPIVDVVSSNPMDYFDFDSFDMKVPLSLHKAIHSIRAAEKDDRIESIYIEASSGCAMSLTTIGELRRAIVDFKEAGKKVYSYSDYYTNSSYYLASVANEVVLAPMGNVSLLGFSSSVTYYKDLFDKVGIDIDLIRVGKYKSAGEPFISNRMSSENRNQLSTFINSMWNVVISDISESRGLTKKEINNMINNLSAVNAQDALSKNLIDDIQYYDQFRAELGDDDKDKDRYISLNSYSSTLMSIRSVKKDGKPILISKNKIALLYATGTIVNGKSGDGTVGDFTLCAQIKKLRKDSTVKAVVFRINSGGGSATASEYMWRELKLLQKEKPLIVSMGSYAASGGYWIATPADRIFAENTTLTGSIGVFSMIPNIKKLEDKIGLNVYNVSTNANSGMLGSFLHKGLSTTERAYLQRSVDDIYTTFIKKVANGRNLSIEKVEKLAQGRIWSGVDAKKNGLVDELGGIVEAIYFAAEKSGVARDFILYEAKAKGDPFSEALAMFSAEAKAMMTPNFGDLQKDIELLTQFSENKGVMAMMPYVIEID